MKIENCSMKNFSQPQSFAYEIVELDQSCIFAVEGLFTSDHVLILFSCSNCSMWTPVNPG